MTDDIRRITVKNALIGLAGQPFTVVISKQRKPSSSSTNIPKKFKVTFTLSRPGQAICSEREINRAELMNGNSHLRLCASNSTAPQKPEPVATFPVLTDDGVFEITESVNADGFIGKLQIESVMATGFFEARDIARKLLLPSISWYATHADIPLCIYQIDVMDLETEDFMIYRASKPYEPVVFAQGIRVLDVKEEPGAYASIYREGLNSNSHVYQFLCFFKIVDGLIARRAKMRTAAVARGERHTQRPERIPDDPNSLIILLDGLFPVKLKWDEIAAEQVFPRKFWGKKITKIADTTLRPLRNELAHAFLESSHTAMPLSFDDAVSVSEVVSLLAMTKCLARWLLKNEFPDQFPS